MKKLNFITFGLVFFGVVGISFAQSTETFTLTTYYPAPYGVYRELRLYPRSTGEVCDATKAGTLEYTDTGQLRHCDGTAWRTITNYWTFDDANDYLYTNDAETAEIWKVGIGTKLPEALLDIKEQGAIGADNILKISSADPNSDLTLYTSGSAGDVKYNFKTSDGSSEYDALTIDTEGNIGVANTDPDFTSGTTGAGYIDAEDVWLRAANGGMGEWASNLGGGGGPGDWDCTFVRRTERWYYNNPIDVWCPADYKIIDSNISFIPVSTGFNPTFNFFRTEYITQGSQFGIRAYHPGKLGTELSGNEIQVNLFCCK
ncbi:MAG: hypothetical protein ABH954_00845 [Candidatus Omnitrophota bacterium]